VSIRAITESATEQPQLMKQKGDEPQFTALAA
jgi:hypothetical protein